MKVTAEQHFWSKVDTSGECWLWTASMSRGYGQATPIPGIGYTGRRAHRIAWALLVGPLPEGKTQLDHRATCPKHCVNPAHLRPVTAQENNENLVGAYRNSSTGVRGVYPTPAGKYRVGVTHHGVVLWFGTYDTIEEAAEVARQKRIELFTHNDLDRVTG
jgi:hypothetical protein